MKKILPLLLLLCFSLTITALTAQTRCATSTIRLSSEFPNTGPNDGIITAYTDLQVKYNSNSYYSDYGDSFVPKEKYGGTSNYTLILRALKSVTRIYGSPIGLISQDWVTKTITIINNTKANLSNLPIGKTNIDASFPLTQGTPSGGTYSGIGTVAGFSFNPAAAGVGIHTITYSVTENGCTTSASKTITIEQGITTELNLPFTKLCSDDSPETLSGGTPSGGTYKVNGTVRSVLDPSIYPAGNVTVEYDNPPYGSDTQTVTIHAAPNVSLAAFDDVYIDTPSFTLTGGNPSGGTYYVETITGGSTTYLIQTTLDPASKGPGTYEIVYKYIDANGCGVGFTDFLSQTIRVKPKEPGVDIPDKPFCKNDPPEALVANLYDGEVKLEGTLLPDAIFDPALYAPGAYNAVYSRPHYEDSHFTVTVKPLPEVTFNPVPDMCENDGITDIGDKVSPSGGTFSGQGMLGDFGHGTSSSEFIPSLKGAGVYTIAYYVNQDGCYASKSQDITVNAVPAVTLLPFDDICQDAGILTLSGGSPSGGTYLVNGAAKTTFNPANYDVGTHTIKYTYTNASGCTESAQQTITVLESPVVTLDNIPDLCENDGPYTLAEGSPVGGTYTCPEKSGAIANGKFYPSLSGDGNFTIIYTYENANGCTNSVSKHLVVNEVPSVSLSNFSDVCKNAPALALTGGSPLGGTYSVDGVVQTTFNPSQYTVGNHIIRYSYTNANGCTSYAEKSIEVLAVDNVSLSPIDPICQNEGFLSFSQGSPSGGDYYVNGLKKTSIDLEGYTPGEQTLKYSYTNASGCTDEQEIRFEILETPTVSLSPFADICKAASGIVLSGGSPSGGTYTVDGTVRTVFYPSTQAVGEHAVSYEYTNLSGCSENASQPITVLASPSVSLSAFADVYIDDAPFLFSGGSPSGGTYYVDGVPGESFDPSSYTPGEYSIAYQYASENLCWANFSQPIKVLALEEGASVPDQDICKGGGLKALVSNLYDGEVRVNGTLLENGIIDPEGFVPGDYAANYSRPNHAPRDFTVSVKEQPELLFAPFADICINSGTINLLSKVSVGGGTFTGIGVNGNIFDPELSGSGLFTITYEATNGSGCETEVTQNIRVYSETLATLTPFSNVCQNQAEFSLVGGQPIGGKYFVNGVERTIFNPIEYTPGTHTVTYQFTNANGCINSASQLITVTESPIATMGGLPDLCEGDAPYILVEGNPSGGIYTCLENSSAVANGKFYPSFSNSGNFTIVYSVTNANGCESSTQQSILVHALPSVSIAPIDDVCQNAPAFFLIGGSPEGGYYTVNGTTQTQFIPANYAVGNHMVRYTYVTPNGCEAYAETTINVKAVTDVSLNAIAPICQNEGILSLSQGRPSGGNYFVNGAQKPSVDLGAYTPGIQTLKYSITNDQACTDEAETDFEILEAPTVSLNDFSPICKDVGSMLLTGGSPIGGTYYVDGIEMTEFNPTNFTTGSHRVSYAYTNGAGCEESVEKIITVLESPEVLLPYFNDVCENEGTFILQGGHPEGGTYFVDGTEKTIFDPKEYSVGTHTITYQYTNASGCAQSAVQSINILPVPVIGFEKPLPICENGEAVLIIGGSPLGGTYSSPYLVNNEFVPAISGSGLHDISYTYQAGNGCFSSITKSVQVLEKPTVTIAPFDPVCQNGDPVVLTGGSPAGGKYYLDNEETNIADPQNIAVGAHTISYVYTDGSGCPNTAETSLNILPAPVVSLADIDPVCQNGNSFILEQGHPEGGTYQVNGTASTSVNPSVFDAGEQVLKYSYTNNYGCTEAMDKNFTILPKPEVTLAAINDVCEDAGSFVLTGGLPLGGTYSGDGVVDGEFYPNIGAGTYTIRYTFTNSDGCSDFAETMVTVLEAPLVVLSRFDDICQNAPSIPLSGGSPIGGHYELDGIQITSFDPSKYEPGTYEISYTYENIHGCSNTVIKEIEVLPIPDVNFEDIDPVCENGNPFILTGGTPKGGAYTSQFVSNGKYYPELSGAGIFPVDYTVANEFGCSVTVSKELVVNELPVVSLPVHEGVCQNSGSFVLTGGSPVGGFYLVNGEEKENFVPADYDIGNQIIEYVYSNENECENRVRSTIMVYKVPETELPVFDPVCQNSGSFTISGGYPTGGKYFVDGLGQSLINPSGYSVGDHEITYVYINTNGCSKPVTEPLTIWAAPEVTAPKFTPVCEDAEPVKLSGGQPLAGYWTGESVVDGTFYPAIGEGAYTLRYTVANENGCESYAEATIEVLAAPKVTLERFDPVCNNAGEFILQGGRPSGGYYQINGQFASKFDPSLYKPGLQAIAYTYANENGCSNYVIKPLEVLEAPEVSLGSFDDICQNADQITLEGGLPTGGKYYINSTQFVTFDPSDHIPGTHPVVYEYVLGNSCKESASGSIEIMEVPEIPSVNTANVYCPGSEINLGAGSKNYAVSWFKEDLSQLKENSKSVKLQGSAPFAAYVQYSNEAGCKSAMKKIDLNVETLFTNIQTNQFEVEQGTPVQLESNATTSGEIMEYYWQFSDGAISHTKNPWHYFNMPGNNDVSLTVKTKNNCIWSQEVKGIIRVSSDTWTKIGNIAQNYEDGFYLEATQDAKALFQIYSSSGDVLFSQESRFEVGNNDVGFTIEAENGTTQNTKGIVRVLPPVSIKSAQSTITIADTSREESSTKIEIGNIYPNPAREDFYFETTGNVKALIQIFSITGNILSAQEAYLEGRHEIDASGLSPGIYFLRVTDLESKRIISIQKLIKQ